MKIADGHQHVMPYLVLNNAMEFLKFTEILFGAELQFKKYRDEKIIMHAELQIGNSTLMFADATDKYPANSGVFYIYTQNTDETYKKALKLGASSVMEPYDESYGARSAAIMDNWGNTWWLANIDSHA